ncbi:uncharacterized protein LOC117568485 [Drosophila albomicans]|uniref:Uncharacterized protein LOC117568485 n=1 Tax=Drosophila albomicans TaxID=7291 RepID=A0A6P8YAG8_DROAB|nr:uncharacterized protein LOC117568485 [Drosophila albomicans]
MEPNRHHEYQTHHHPQSHHQLQPPHLQQHPHGHGHGHGHNHGHPHPQHAVHHHLQHHHQQPPPPATATTTVAPPPQQATTSGPSPHQHHLPMSMPLHHQQQQSQQQPQHLQHHPHHHQQQQAPPPPQQSSYQQSHAAYVRGGAAAASVMPPTGAAASGASGAAGGDPHMQYYTSNRELIVAKKSNEPQLPHASWQQYKAPPTGATSTTSTTSTLVQRQPPQQPPPQPQHYNSNSYWQTPPEEQHMARYGYSKVAPPRTTAISSSSSVGGTESLGSIRGSLGEPGRAAGGLGETGGMRGAAGLGGRVAGGTGAPSGLARPGGLGTTALANHRYYEDNLKYAPSGKLHSSATATRYELLDHVVNPSNALLGTASEQQPSPNYARKCPQHYEPPTEQRGAAATLGSAPGLPGQAAPPQGAAPGAAQQHQSLYMPMPQFSTENFQSTVHSAIEKYVRESAPAPSLDYRRSTASGGYGSRPTSGNSQSVSQSGSYYSSSKPLASYGKLEPESSSGLTRASLYHNPYNPPAVVEPDQLPTAAASSRDASPAAPHGYPTKYGKLLQQHSSQPRSSSNSNASASSSSSANPASYVQYYHHGTPSPAAAQVASPTPPQQLYNHTPPPSGGVGPGLGSASGGGGLSSAGGGPGLASSVGNAPGGLVSHSTLQVYPHGPDICCQPKMTPLPPKKSNAPSVKPNYKALIDDMLKQNISEKERNLKIIEKTLGSRQVPAAAPAPVLVPPPTVPQPILAPVIQQAPLAHSPLDLSMRTVKQTADSTEYKYKPKAAASPGTGLGLPRFDITPNFARSSGGSSSGGSGTSSAAATAVIRQAPAANASILTSASAASTESPLLIKAAQQLRPSVLETNPFAKRPQLPPETSIRALPKPPTATATTTASVSSSSPNPTPIPSSSSIAVPSSSNLHNSSNPNYLGRKRHLQEYNQQAAAALAKQSRLDAIPAPPMAASVPVIAINEQALAKQRLENSGSSIIVCPQPKQETQPLVPKMEPRIRTKAELKGFTFTPPVLAAASSTTSSIGEVNVASTSNSTATPTTTPSPAQLTNHIQIKLEPAPTPEQIFTQLPEESPSSSGFNSHSLLGDWGSTCNNLVEQLLNKVLPTKPMTPTTTPIKLELSEDDLPVARILKRQPTLPDVESAATTTTQLTSNTTTNGTQKKLSKTEREKKRLVQEQRIAARLAPTAGQSSSSESDTTELHKRKTERQKKPLMMRKSKNRRAEEKEKEQVKGKQEQSQGKRQEESSDEEQEQAENDDNSSSEAKKGKRTLKNKLQYAGGKNKTKGQQKQRDKEKEREKEKTNDKKEQQEDEDQDESSTSSSNEEEQQKEQAAEEDDDDEEEEEDEEQEKEDDEDEENEESDEDEDENEDEADKQPSVKRTKPKANTKPHRIALNTMTRSKRKQELEQQLANSKVLRNDKIIRNSTTKIKRKYVRKLVPDAKKEMMVTRLRNKRVVVSADQLNGRKLKAKAKAKTTTPQQQLFLEEYRYKLALKIPQRLISINKLNKLPQVAASLPDLERGRDLRQELACFKPARGRKPRAKATAAMLKEQPAQPQRLTTPQSIIDVLHLRVTSNGAVKSGQPVNCAASLHTYSETSQTSASNSLYEQPQETSTAATPDTGKRHFSIFDTKVLQSKTRTESKLQQHREIIREIFVGTERPASAPPECAQEQDQSPTLSYTQYEEFLEQMNRIGAANNNKLARHRTNIEVATATPTTPASGSSTQCPHKRKYLRRKGSSGFDYIRKKKRPTPHPPANSSNTNQSNNLQNANQEQEAASSLADADERLDDTDSTIAGSTSHLPLKVKTEVDIYREIQKWVLNKGVGQSTMHKAARQGLIDVVVYCLDRMGMNPDQKDNAGYTPLHEACTQGWLEIARLLLQFGANHSEAAQSGIRPLHGAIENDHEEVVRLLLSYGADPLLATYSGQTPLMLASSKLMCSILRSHLSDAQSASADIKPMRFQGPWEIFDEKENGFDIFDNVPNTACDMSRALRRERRRRRRNRSQGNSNKNSNSNGGLLLQTKDEVDKEKESKEMIKQNGETSAKTLTTAMAMTMVKLEPGTEDSNNNKNNGNNEHNNDNSVERNVTSVVNVKNEVKLEPQDDDEMNANNINNDNDNTLHYLHANHNDHANDLDHDHDDDEDDDADADVDNERETLTDELNGDIFEFEEADVPLPPLYLLKDEGSDKWVLLNDLCNLLKVKSKDTLLNKICPNSTTMASTQKQLLREFKIDDFLEQATCLQLLCAGEKLNMFSSSKVVLIRYNESVRNLLGVKTILMKF